MKLQQIFQNDLKYPFGDAAKDSELGTQVQAILVTDHLLAPPADGVIGPETEGAIAQFQQIMKLPPNQFFDRPLARALIQTPLATIPQSMRLQPPSAFQEAFHLVLQYEGGLCCDPGDPGGLTNLGLCKFDQLTDDEIRAMTPEKAEPIYKKKYWDKICGDELAEISRKIAIAVFDFTVNAGAKGQSTLQQAENEILGDEHGVKALQSAIQVAVDGQIGEQTLAVLKMEIEDVPDAENRILCNYFGIRKHCYQVFAAHGQSQFYGGWMTRCRQLAKHLEILDLLGASY